MNYVAQRVVKVYNENGTYVEIEVLWRTIVWSSVAHVVCSSRTFFVKFCKILESWVHWQFSVVQLKTQHYHYMWIK